jgi:peptidoglycan/xylan/chitin deacetylase (PgdA/CDA1 family)
LKLLADIPHWMPRVFPRRQWFANPENNSLYLTFDDGPHPEITPQVLNLLDAFGAKATFFCIGDNVRKYPDTYAEILRRGHRTGNHTMQHLKGWQTPADRYISNVREAATLIESPLFRPPYGRMTGAQAHALQPDYRIVMWSLLSRDYLQSLHRPAALDFLKKRSRAGDILVFHDSEKARKNLEFLLPHYLEFAAGKGFTFAAL